MHWVAWHGQTNVVRLLLKHAAPIDILDDAHKITPLVWAADGSSSCGDAKGDYYLVAKSLLDAGAEANNLMIKDATGEVRKILWKEIGK